MQAKCRVPSVPGIVTATLQEGGNVACDRRLLIEGRREWNR